MLTSLKEASHHLQASRDRRARREWAFSKTLVLIFIELRCCVTRSQIILSRLLSMMAFFNRLPLYIITGLIGVVLTYLRTAEMHFQGMLPRSTADGVSQPHGLSWLAWILWAAVQRPHGNLLGNLRGTIPIEHVCSCSLRTLTRVSARFRISTQPLCSRPVREHIAADGTTLSLHLWKLCSDHVEGAD